MAYANPRIQSLSDIGPSLRTLMSYTLADYAAAGTYAGAVGDIVTFSSTGNWYCKIAPDDTTKRLGVVRKVEKAAAGTNLGYLVVEWFDIYKFVKLTTDDLATCTLGNAAIKDGNTTVYDNFDAGATTGNLVVVAKSGTSGAGTIVAAVVAL